MKRTLVISLVMSLVVTLFFTLVWISIYQQFQAIRDFVPQFGEGVRIMTVIIPVFLTSLVLYLVNFQYLAKYNDINSWIPRMGQILINLVLVVGIAFLFYKSTDRVIQETIGRPLLVLIMVRNAALSIFSMLVTYAYTISQKSKRAEFKMLGLENEKMQAELGALKAQVDPHFLFNSLNSLTGVIRQDQKEAIKFVNHLSQTMRYTLDNKGAHLVSLKEELEYLKSYEFMMKIRFGEGFVIKTMLDDQVLDRKLPQFALQLLVENAIKHNKASLKSPLQIDIHMSGDLLEVVNNLQPKASVPKGYGFGLANLSQRYELLDMPPIEIAKGDDNFSVKLSLS